MLAPPVSEFLFLAIKPGLSARIDFNEEKGATDPRQHEIEKILRFPDGMLDYCVVRVSSQDQSFMCVLRSKAQRCLGAALVFLDPTGPDNCIR